MSCKLPPNKLQKILPVSIPVSKVTLPSSKVSIPVSILTATGGIVVQVRKIEAAVNDLKKDMAEETVQRIGLQVCVEKLIAENAEAKTKIVEQSNPIRIFLKMLPCTEPIRLDELLVFIENETRCLQLTEFIKSLGGRDSNEAIKLTLSALMDRSLRKQLSWTGCRTNKPSFQFKYKNILDCIHIAMKDTFKDYTIASGETKMKSIFQNAK